MYYANPPEDWLKINNFKLREQNRIEIIEGVRKGPLWNAVYLLYQGDVFNKDVSNPYRHKLVATLLYLRKIVTIARQVICGMSSSVFIHVTRRRKKIRNVINGGDRILRKRLSNHRSRVKLI